MARPARFSDSDLLDAAAEVAAAHGPAATTISAIAQAAGAPTGSLYHRFPSRDVLLGTLWLDLIGRFQAGWIEALEALDPEAAARERRWSEYWTFIRNRNAPPIAAKAELNCPNCGAPLKVNSVGVCQFCGGKITSGEFDWVLSRIEQDESYSG